MVIVNCSPKPPAPNENGSVAAVATVADTEREALYARQALRGPQKELAAMAPNSGRNDTLNKKAYHLARMAANGWIDPADIADGLWQASEENGLVRDDGIDAVQRTLASGMEAGLKVPAEGLEDRPALNGGSKPAVGNDDEPLPLTRELPPADEFPIDALSPMMAAGVHALHVRTQAPYGVCGNTMVAVAALAAQAHRNVVLPTGQAKPISSYFVTVAKTGERKTSVDNWAWCR